MVQSAKGMGSEQQKQKKSLEWLQPNLRYY